MITDVLQSYPAVSRAALISPELLIILGTIAWMWLLGWLLIREVSKDENGKEDK